MPIKRLKTLHSKTTFLLWVLNITDLLFTLFFIGNKWATEGNPLLLYFFNVSVWAFVISKLAISTAGVVVLARYPDKDIAVLGAAFLSGIYVSLFFFQAYMAVTGLL